MKTMIKRILLIGTLIISLFSSNFAINAYASSVDVNVGYAPEEEYLSTFQMKVEITGDGEVLDNGKNVKNNTIYTLHCDDWKNFQLKAKNGYYVKSIYYDDKDISDTVFQGVIKVQAKDYDTVLQINFAKKTDVETGDSTNRNQLLFILSGVLLVIVLIRKRKEEGRL